ncbi:hypothetical protein Ae263Ps1_5627 [Pseudonocardia sp. Ae263_Ps1]|nr:hypothetical protein Ae150APs1_5696c [Pseudonocardia sp. Ae150A_Ps1]OLL88572.1 hypothetical protein Ae263Ps1_5627 [Pseudonocardia sp. Ae263_Ps1]OLL91407.1 hypothetical protein Ae356Ps1_1304c [Pseudonocardia sp. Ae356_Ps1]
MRAAPITHRDRCRLGSGRAARHRGGAEPDREGAHAVVPRPAAPDLPVAGVVDPTAAARRRAGRRAARAGTGRRRRDEPAADRPGHAGPAGHPDGRRGGTHRDRLRGRAGTPLHGRDPPREPDVGVDVRLGAAAPAGARRARGGRRLHPPLRAGAAAGTAARPPPGVPGGLQRRDRHPLRARGGRDARRHPPRRAVRDGPRHGRAGAHAAHLHRGEHLPGARRGRDGDPRHADLTDPLRRRRAHPRARDAVPRRAHRRRSGHHEPPWSPCSRCRRSSPCTGPSWSASSARRPTWTPRPACSTTPPGTCAGHRRCRSPSRNGARPPC